MSDTNVHGLRVYLSFPYFHAAVQLQLFSKSELPLRARENVCCSRKRTSNALLTASFYVGHSHHRIILSRSVSRRVNFSRRFTLRKFKRDGAFARTPPFTTAVVKNTGTPTWLMVFFFFVVSWHHFLEEKKKYKLHSRFLSTWLPLFSVLVKKVFVFFCCKLTSFFGKEKKSTNFIYVFKYLASTFFRFSKKRFLGAYIIHWLRSGNTMVEYLGFRLFSSIM